jgi:hypothetical protein
LSFATCCDPASSRWPRGSATARTATGAGTGSESSGSRLTGPGRSATRTAAGARASPWPSVTVAMGPAGSVPSGAGRGRAASVAASSGRRWTRTAPTSSAACFASRIGAARPGHTEPATLWAQRGYRQPALAATVQLRPGRARLPAVRQPTTPAVLAGSHSQETSMPASTAKSERLSQQAKAALVGRARDAKGHLLPKGQPPASEAQPEPAKASQSQPGAPKTEPSPSSAAPSRPSQTSIPTSPKSPPAKSSEPSDSPPAGGDAPAPAPFRGRGLARLRERRQRFMS